MTKEFKFENVPVDKITTGFFQVAIKSATLTSKYWFYVQLFVECWCEGDWPRLLSLWSFPKICFLAKCGWGACN